MTFPIELSAPMLLTGCIALGALIASGYSEKGYGSSHMNAQAEMTGIFAYPFALADVLLLAPTSPSSPPAPPRSSSWPGSCACSSSALWPAASTAASASDAENADARRSLARTGSAASATWPPTPPMTPRPPS